VSDVDWIVGIDWGATAHAVCLLDRTGRLEEQRMVEHTSRALHAFVEELTTRSHGALARVAVAIETPRGALVELLVERGCAVYAINPKQLDRFRDRFTAAGAKDDRRDARVLADSWRTDPQAFRRVQLDHPLIVQLREWSRLDDDLGTEVTRLTNQLCALVYRVSPALLRLCPGADEPWLWAVLAEAPTPQAQQRLTVRRVARLLRAQQVRRLTAADLHAALQAPPIALIPGVVDAVTAHYQVLLPRLRLTVQQRRDATRELERLLAAYAAASTSDEDQREHPDVTILRSMPGVGKRVAARMLAEASQPLVARAYHTLRALMGVAPVTRQSGQSRTVLMRRACNTRLRDTAYHWGRVGIQHDPPSRAYYAALRARGHSHGRALRSVVDRSLRILMHLLARGECFNPSHRPAEMAATCP
jgi:transposase